MSPPKLAPSILPPRLPAQCSLLGNPQGERGNYEIRFVFSCQHTLTADEKILLPWKREGALLTVAWKNHPPVTKMIQREGKFITIDLEQFLTSSGSFWKAAKRYLTLGIEHILEGFDHLLFILGLLLIVKGTWRLVKTITAFTIAHSITLGLATLGVVNVPSAPVEATIALSIVFLAVEIVYASRGKFHLTHKKPWLIAFGFGLLHGLGFAGALSEIGLPQGEIPVALLFFNIGVEVGQLIFVASILACGWCLNQFSKRYPYWVRMIPSYGIGTIACFWLFERVADMVGIA